MKKGKLYYVYIMASYRRVLYIGITSKLEQRVWQHKQGVFPEGFSARYRIHKLVYFETYSDIAAAIAREKELKGWLRSRKIALLPVRTPATNIAQDAASPDPSFGRKRRAQDDTLDKHLRLEEHNRFFVIQLKSETPPTGSLGPGFVHLFT